MYHMQEDNLYMIPTAEVPLTSIYRDVVLGRRICPKICGYTLLSSRPVAMARTSAA